MTASHSVQEKWLRNLSNLSSPCTHIGNPYDICLGNQDSSKICFDAATEHIRIGPCILHWSQAAKLELGVLKALHSEIETLKWLPVSRKSLLHSCLDDKSNPISKSNDKFINRDNNRNSNRNTTAVAITIALATAIANANEHTKIVRITFVWGPRAGIILT